MHFNIVNTLKQARILYESALQLFQLRTHGFDSSKNCYK